MKNIIAKILDYARYPSTWSGIIKLVAGTFGVSISADLTTQIVALGVAGAGIIGILFSDSDVKPS